MYMIYDLNFASERLLKIATNWQTGKMLLGDIKVCTQEVAHTHGLYVSGDPGLIWIIKVPILLSAV